MLAGCRRRTPNCGVRAYAMVADLVALKACAPLTASHVTGYATEISC